MHHIDENVPYVNVADSTLPCILSTLKMNPKHHKFILTWVKFKKGKNIVEVNINCTEAKCYMV